MAIRIIIVDDHRIVREGLRGLLDAQPDMEVVAEAGDGRSALRLVQEHSPSVVVMDVSMPDLNGIEATRQITGRAPGVRVLALSMHGDGRFVAGMLGAGAAGYLAKDCASEELVVAIHTVVAKQTYLSPAMAQVVVRDYRQGDRRQALPRRENGRDPPAAPDGEIRDTVDRRTDQVRHP